MGNTAEDPEVVGDFIRNGMDALIDEEFSDKDSPKVDNDERDDDTESDEEEVESEETKDKKESELSPEGLGEEDESDDETEDEEDDQEKKDTDEKRGEKDQADSKQKSPIAAARAEFKELFKKHPQIEKDYFYGVEMRKLFNTPEEAVEVIETKEYIDDLVVKSLKGDPQPLLEGLYEASGENKEGFLRFAMSFLPTIAETAPKLAEKIIEKPIINVFAQLGQAAEARGDDQLALAVKYCMKELFGKAVIPAGQKMGKFIKDTRDVDNEIENLNKTAEADFYKSIHSGITPILLQEIEDGLSEDSNISDGIKETIKEKILNEVFAILNEDEKHLKIMSRLKKAARANRYSNEYKKKVAREVIEASKMLIPELTPKIERSVLGNIRKKDNNTNGNKTSDRKIGGSSEPRNSHGSRTRDEFDIANIDFSRTTLRDALDFDPKKVVFKKQKQR